MEQASAAAPLPERASATMPHFDLSKDRHASTIRVNGWTIAATKRPILNGKEIEAAEKTLSLPLPEMTFGNNSLLLSYDPSSSSSTSATASSSAASKNSSASEGGKVEIRFGALEALAAVATGEGWEERVGGGVKVSMAESWGKRISAPSALLGNTPLPSKPVKPHDWTYSSTHSGSVAGPSRFEPSSSHSIPMTLLARQDPVLDQILFYDDVPLFEDELHDNGESMLNARIRVMPHSWFVLARLFLRVDNVLFRMFDVRLYHSFGSGQVIREVSGMEVEYDEVKRVSYDVKSNLTQVLNWRFQRLEKSSDLSPLTNPNFVHQVMMSLQPPSEDGAADRPGMEHRPSSRTTGKPWPGLGKRVEVLRLPGGVDRATDGIEKLAI